jgi:hypothetical protein
MPFMNEPLRPLRERTLEQIILDVLQRGGGLRVERVRDTPTCPQVELRVWDDLGKTKAFVISETQWRGTREELKGTALRDALNECERRVFG